MTLWQDVRYAIRVMRSSPVLSLAGMVALALGIGACTAIFSVADAVLLKPLSIPDDRGLLNMYETASGAFDPTNSGVSNADYFDWKAQSRSFENMAAFEYWSMNLRSGGFPEQVLGSRVTHDFFSVLRARPALGRTFATGENQPGHERVVVLSYGLWQRHFAGDPGVVGRTIRVNFENFTVAGVMPKDFAFPQGSDLWIPIPLSPADMADRANRALQVIGRLRPGATLLQGEAELQTITKRLAAAYPNTNHGLNAQVLTAREFLTGQLTTQYMKMLLVAVGFVLLIACANVANVLFARSIARQKEIALRTALGAGRWRLVRQLLTESILLSGSSAVLGVLLAQWELGLILSHMPATIMRFLPWWQEIALDWRALVFTAAVAIAAGVVSGLLPAVQSSRPDLNSSLKEGTRGTSARRQHRFRNALLVGEVALSLVLLIGAGLMARGVGALRAAPDILQPQHILKVRLSLPDQRYHSNSDERQFFDRLLAGLSEIPGVQHAAVSNAIPYQQDGGDSPQPFTIEGRPIERGAPPSALVVSASPAFFPLLGLALRQGRLPAASDGENAPKVAVISEALARRYWPGQDPIGHRVKAGLSDSTGSWMTVVGVVNNLRYNSFDRAPELAIYRPASQAPQQYTMIALRTADPAGMIATVRARVAALDPELPAYSAESLSTSISNALIGLSYVAVMMSILGVMALIMASVGICGAMAFSVTERTREIGIRLALGAETHSVLTMVVRHAAMLTFAGLAIGLVCSAALARLLSSLIWGISALDLRTFAGVSALLFAVALLASYIPARRAARVDPLISLRNE